MTEEDKKILVLFLIGDGQTNGDVVARFWAGNSNRTFTAWQDLGDLKEKLDELGMLDKFEDWMTNTDCDSFLRYFINPVRFCQLVANYLKEET